MTCHRSPFNQKGRGASRPQRHSGLFGGDERFDLLFLDVGIEAQCSAQVDVIAHLADVADDLALVGDGLAIEADVLCGAADEAEQLLHKLAQITVERGCGRLEWWCLDWNQPSIDLYRSLGAELMDEWTTYRLTGEALQSFARDDVN